MMKKNMRLIAVMALLSAGYSYGSGAVTITAQAQNVITQAFASMDDWMQRDLVGSVYVPVKSIAPSAQEVVNKNEYLQSRIGTMSNSSGSIEEGYRLTLSHDLNAQILPSRAYSGRAKYGYSSQSKVSQATQYMNDALDNLGKTLGNVPGMQTVKKTAGRAIKALATETTNDEINSAALRGIVNTVKIMMLAPVKIAVQIAAQGVGMAAGAVGGAVTGLGAGMNRAAQDVMNQKIDMSLQSIVEIFPTTIYRSLKGIVSTAALTAYGTVEGVMIGSRLGSSAGARATGDVFDLEKPDSASGSNSSRSKAINDANSKISSFVKSGDNFTDPNSVPTDPEVPTDPVQKANYLYDATMTGKANFNNAVIDYHNAGSNNGINSPETTSAYKNIYKANSAYENARDAYYNHLYSKGEQNLTNAQMGEHNNYIESKQAATSE